MLVNFMGVLKKQEVFAMLKVLFIIIMLIINNEQQNSFCVELIRTF